MGGERKKEREELLLDRFYLLLLILLYIFLYICIFVCVPSSRIKFYDLSEE